MKRVTNFEILKLYQRIKLNQIVEQYPNINMIFDFWDHLKCDLQVFQCVGCRSLNTFALYHCKNCLDHIERSYLNPRFQVLKFETAISDLESEIKIQTIEVLSFIDWRSDEERRVASIVKLMKHPFARSNWKYAAQLSSPKVRFCENSIFVPIPGHSQNSTHSKFFAQELANRNGCRYSPFITKIERYIPPDPSNAQSIGLAVVQKDLDQASRTSSEIRIYVDFTILDSIPRGATITLTDDIMTTGTTISKVASAVWFLRPDLKLKAVVFAQRPLERDFRQSSI